MMAKVKVPIMIRKLVKAMGLTRILDDPCPQSEKDDEKADFTSLPFHFIVQLAKYLTFKELVELRLTCKKATEAVAHCGKTHRAFDIARLIAQLWPEKRAAVKYASLKCYDSLYGLHKEMTFLCSWLDVGLITSIDFEGIATMNSPQLEMFFGMEPRRNVKKLNLAGTVVTPDVWETLARLFPAVTNLRCTEESSQFPDEIRQAATARPALRANVFVNQQEMVQNGLLDSDRIVTMRCLKALFPALRSMDLVG